MIELTGKPIAFAYNQDLKTAILTLSVNEKGACLRAFDDYKDRNTDIVIKSHREKRSLNANAYMWLLCSKLADKLNTEDTKITKEDIYRAEIKGLNVYYDDEIVPDQVERRIKAWELIGTGWIAERVDFSADGNKEIIRFYYGSSMYNSKQMSRLINNLIQDCKEQGIETRTKEEIESMIREWGYAKE